MVPAVAMATTFSGPKQHLDFEAMAENFRSISVKQGQGEKIDQATFDQVKNFIYQVSTLVKGALDTDEEYAQSIYNKSVADVEACDTTRQEAFDGAVQNASDAANGSWTVWEQCKDEEQIEYDNMTEHCRDVNEYVDAWNDGDHCAGVDFTLGDSDAVEQYMICICKFVEDHKDNYYEKRWNCTEATQDHADKKQECCNPGKQADFDDAMCAEQTAIQDMCHDYKVCRDREEGELNVTKATVMQWEDVMQAQRVALEQLICFGNHIMDNNTDLSGCDDLSFTDCTKYTDCPMIVYHEPAPFVGCTEPSEDRLPCTIAYKNKWHWVYNGTDTPASKCKEPCATTFPFQYSA